MALPDTSKMIAKCKDQMHNEWADFKKLGLATAMPVCRYSIGGSKDIPCGVLLSIGQGVVEWDKCLKTTFDVMADRSKFISKEEVAIGADGQAVLYPKRKDIIIDETASTSSSTPAPSIKG